MKKRFFISIALWIGMFYSVYGQTPISEFQKANGLYEKKDYTEAVDVYKSILAQGNKSKELYYNYGNTLLAMDSIGQAVLQYERGLKLDPSDAFLQNNLSIARERIEEPLVVIPDFFLMGFWKSFYSTFSPRTWALLSILIGILLIGLVYVYLYDKVHLPKKWYYIGVGLTAILLLSTICAGSARTSQAQRQDKGVVMMRGWMKNGPDDRSDDIKILYPGYQVRVIDELNGWKKVMTRDREIGWVKPESYTII